MENSNFKVRTQEYFEAFKTKNISILNDLYSNDIILIDWDVNIYGKSEVLKNNNLLFKKDFKLEVFDIVQNNNQTINTLFIEIPEHNIAIEVVDIITFNPKTFEIEKIRAYKG
jgi:hypothetical protein